MPSGHGNVTTVRYKSLRLVVVLKGRFQYTIEDRLPLRALHRRTKIVSVSILFFRQGADFGLLFYVAGLGETIIMIVCIDQIRKFVNCLRISMNECMFSIENPRYNRNKSDRRVSSIETARMWSYFIKNICRRCLFRYEPCVVMFFFATLRKPEATKIDDHKTTKKELLDVVSGRRTHYASA